MGLSEIKNRTGLKHNTLLWEGKQMQFWNTEKKMLLVWHTDQFPTLFKPLQPWSSLGPSISKEKWTIQREILWEWSQVQHTVRNIRLGLLHLEQGMMAAGETWKPAWGSWWSWWDKTGHAPTPWPGGLWALNFLYVKPTVPFPGFSMVS